MIFEFLTPSLPQIVRAFGSEFVLYEMAYSGQRAMRRAISC